jgi:teichuronic acid biosynthesis glycosyltransferase TuaC
MKKVLIFSLAYYPHVGGAEVAIKEITDRIRDIEFHMVTLRFGREPRQERVGNVLVHRIGGGGRYLSKILFVPRAAFAAARLHREQKFDGVWAMMSYMVFPVVLMRFLGAKVPYALTIQEGDPYEHVFHRPIIKPFLPLLRSGFRNARVVQTISTFLGGWAEPMGYRGPIEVIPNGVDVSCFKGAPIAHEGTVLVTSSRLVRKNAIDDIIRALAQLPAEVRLDIAGSGPEEPALRHLARDLHVEGRIRFLGHVDHAQLPVLLRAADVFVRPSRSEGMGNSFIEAMAAGLPVVATQEGGLKDFISSETAWVVRKDHPEDIAECVKDILGNRERTAAVVQRSLQMIEASYDWSVIARAMESRVFSKLW